MEFSLPPYSPCPSSTSSCGSGVRMPTPSVRVLGEGGDDDFDMVAGGDSDCEDAGSSLPVSLASSLASPGLLHVVHNAAHDILSMSPLLSEAVDKRVLASEMMSDKGRRARLLETCFSNPVGLQLHGQLLGFRGRVYRDRWGSVALICCRSILDVQKPLCWGWDLPRYMGDAKAGTDALDMDAALRSAQLWGAISTLDALYGIIRHCFLWCEGCACHAHLLSEGAPQEVRKRWAACPLRGLRLPEVAAGSFFDMFRSLAERTAVSLFVSLPNATLSDADRADLLQAFERSRASMLLTFTLKLSCFLSPPLLLFATARYSQVVAQEALRQCMESDCTHPLVVQLQQAPLFSQAAAFLEGWELAGLPELEGFIASLRSAHGVERQIEGGHATVNRRAGLARGGGRLGIPLRCACVRSQRTSRSRRSSSQPWLAMSTPLGRPRLWSHRSVCRGIQRQPLRGTLGAMCIARSCITPNFTLSFACPCRSCRSTLRSRRLLRSFQAEHVPQTRGLAR